jgi:hypothetical protein
VIPEAAVEAVAERNYEAEWGDGWEGVIEQIKRGWLNEARAQCEAAAPHMLRAAKAEAWDECDAAKYVVMLKADGSGLARVKNNPYRSQS